MFEAGTDSKSPLAPGATSTLNRVLMQRADSSPDAVALRFFRSHLDQIQTLTYGQLYHAAEEIAAALRARDLNGARVVLFFEAGFDFVQAFCGCLLADVVAVPLPIPRPRRGLHRIQSVFADCAPAAILTNDAVHQPVSQIAGAIEGFPVDGLLSVEALQAESNVFAEDTTNTIGPDSLAMLQYTSGSTGTPKGVRIRQRNLVANIAAMAERLACTPNDIGVSWLPHYHDMGLMGGILLPLFAGFETVLFSPVTFVDQPLLWLEAISRFQATITGGPNFAYEMCARRATPGDIAQLQLGSWRLAFSGSEMVQPEVLDQFARKFAAAGFQRQAFLPCYGLAESTLFVSGRRDGESTRVLSLDRDALQRGLVTDVPEHSPNSKKVVSLGSPTENHHIVIAAPNKPRQLADGQIGEVCLAGPSLTDGYWSRSHQYFEPESNDQRPATRYLRTGDLGFLQNGELFITGRSKDVIILRGMNVYPDDIEMIVERAHPAVRSSGAAAFAVERDGQEHAAVVLELRRDRARNADLDAIFEAVRETLSDELGIQLSAIVALTQQRLPRTSSGKKQRRRCAELFESGSLEGVLGSWYRGDFEIPVKRDKNANVLHHNGNGSALKSNGAKQVEVARQTDPELSNGTRSDRHFARRHRPQSDIREDRQTAEPIAVVGMSCRFPGADGLDAFARMLEERGSGIVEVPPDRWDAEALYAADHSVPGKMVSRWGGFLPDIAQFDPEFFGLTPREARKMDPQQRLLLELTWQALEDSGLQPGDLRGTPTGVFVGIGNSDYTTVNVLAAPAFREVDAYSGTGNAHSLAANRISFLYDFHGPSLAIDTACSSSLVALHYACQSLRSGECETAIVGGVNAILSPVVSIAFSNAHMLSPDGRCYPFDSRANGYVRSEGCGVVVLKPQSQAIKDGDRILGVIRGTAVNHVGFGTGITVPSAPSQRETVVQALKMAGLSPDRLNYIEAHGTGTPVGDPIELAGLVDLFRRNELRDHRCLFGSVKGNVGHLETASGMASLIKVLLMLSRQRIYPQANFKYLNPAIDLSGTRLEPALDGTEWVTDGQARLAGVSSFGFGGANAHAIVEEATTSRQEMPVPGERPVLALTVSAHSADALPRVARDYEQWIEQHADAPLADFCFSVNTARSDLAARTMIVAEDRAALQQGLKRLADRSPALAPTDRNTTGTDRKIAFLCTGQGSQYAGMSRELFQSEPVFRKALDRCAEILDSLLDRPLKSLLFPEDAASCPLDLTQYAQPAIFAVEWSLAAMWQHWGVKPDALLGHSVGEYVAATLAGVLSLEDGLRLIARRGELMGRLSQGGGMAVVMAAEKRVRPFLDDYDGRISIAAVNGPRLTNLSGENAALDDLLQRLAAEKLTAKRLNVSEAFHSALIEPILDEFEQFAATIPHHPPQIPLVSNVTGEFFPAGEGPHAAYWRQHARGAVMFEAGMKSLVEAGCRTFLEVGPSPNLTSMGRTCVPSGKTRWLTSLQPNRSDWEIAGKSLQMLYEDGIDIDWKAFDRGHSRQRTSLPAYPFQRDRYWIDRQGNWYDSGTRGTAAHPLLGTKTQESQDRTVYQSVLDPRQLEWLSDHQLFQSPVFPAAGFLEIGLAAAQETARGTLSVRDVTFRELLAPAQNGETQLRTEIVAPGTPRARLEIFSRRDVNGHGPWALHTAARLQPKSRDPIATVDLIELRNRCPHHLQGDAFYESVSRLGLDYHGAFRSLQEIQLGNREAFCELTVPALASDERYQVFPALIDTGLQLLGAASAGGLEPNATYVPVQVGAVDLLSRLTGRVVIHAQLLATDQSSREGEILGQIDFLADDGNVLLRLSDVRFAQWGHSHDGPNSATHSRIGVKSWKRLDALPELSQDALQAQADWVILSGGSDVSQAMVERLRRSGHSPTVIALPAFAEKVADVLASTTGERPLRIIHLGALEAASDAVPLETGDALDRDDLEAINSIQTAGMALINAARQRQIHLLIPTRGAQVVNSAPEPCSPLQALAWDQARGMIGRLSLSSGQLVDLGAKESPEVEAETLLAEFLSCQENSEVALRPGERWAPELVPQAESDHVEKFSLPVSTPNACLEVGDELTLDSLHFRGCERRAPGNGEVEIEIEAAGLNFSDVLKTLGLYPQDDPQVSLGLECCGRITAVGNDVSGWSVGDRVAALAPQCFGRFVIAPTFGLVRCPDDISATEAAAQLVADVTALYALKHLARLQAGDTVLIHSAAGGVGHAAIRIAQDQGATIFATAGNDEKRAYLRSLGIEQVFDSRTTDFVDAIRELTDGAGVSVVLNSLGGEGAARSLDLLSPFGRFIDLAKTDIVENPWLDRSRFRNNLSYCGVDLDQLYRTSPELIQQLLAEVPLDSGRLKMPVEVFPLENARNAFRMMAQRRHIGKIVLQVGQTAEGSRRPVPFGKSGSLLLAGQIAADAVSLATAAIAAGTRSLIAWTDADTFEELKSRLPNLKDDNISLEWVDRAQARSLSELNQALAELDRRQVSPINTVLFLASELPLGSAFVRENGSAAEICEWLWTLHQATSAGEPVTFVTLSPLAGLAASHDCEEFCDALMRERWQLGQSALSVGIGPMSATEGENLADRILTAVQNGLAAGIAQMSMADWNDDNASAWFAGTVPSLYRSLLSPSESATPFEASEQGLPLAARLKAAEPAEQPRILTEHFLEILGRVTSQDVSRIKPETSIRRLGLDSLMTMELKNSIERALTININLAVLLQDPTIEQLAASTLTLWRDQYTPASGGLS